MIGTPAVHVNKGNSKNTLTEEFNGVVVIGDRRLAHPLRSVIFTDLLTRKTLALPHSACLN
jgi:hypothetical protein